MSCSGEDASDARNVCVTEARLLLCNGPPEPEPDDDDDEEDDEEEEEAGGINAEVGIKDAGMLATAAEDEIADAAAAVAAAVG